MKYKKEQAKLSPNINATETSKTIQSRGRKKSNNQQAVVDRLLAHSATYFPTSQEPDQDTRYSLRTPNVLDSLNRTSGGQTFITESSQKFSVNHNLAIKADPRFENFENNNGVIPNQNVKEFIKLDKNSQQKDELYQSIEQPPAIPLNISWLYNEDGNTEHQSSVTEL